MNVLAYVGEIRMFAGSTPPDGWLLCDGKLYNIWEQERLFTSIGTYYGGDGQSNFAVPNLCGRVPVSIGPGPDTLNLTLGQRMGTETVSLLAANLPAHNHPVNGTTATVAANSPGNNFLGVFPQGASGYVTRDGDPTKTPIVTMSGSSVTNTGGGGSAAVVQAYVPVNYIIATDGLLTPPSF